METIKTIKDFINDFDKTKIDELRTKFNKRATDKKGFSLTERLDAKKDIPFDQDMINEIVLWKVNRYVNVGNSSWLEDFNNLKDVPEIDDNNKEHIKEILKKMIDTNGIRLPMASTMLSFRNPRVFQIIDIRTFHVMYGDDDVKKKVLDANNDESIKLYFDYLVDLKKEKITFCESDRILYQYDIEENKKYYIEKKKKIEEKKKSAETN